jgi:hypothetical protein
MMEVLIITKRSSLKSGWEWGVLQALAHGNFEGLADGLDKVTRVVGTLLCLRLSIQHRHERVISYSHRSEGGWNLGKSLGRHDS